MGAVKSLGERFRKEATPDRAEFIESLRAFYHSLDAEERDDVIELLGSLSEADAARELIQLYEDCQWRATRFKIVQALGRNTSHRGLAFLFRLARNVGDLPLAESALRAIGENPRQLGARFLVHYYPFCPEILKPALVGALGRVADRTLVRELTQELGVAIRQDKPQLLRNLVLALGELKVAAALPLLAQVATRRKLTPRRAGPDSVELSALLAIGKIGRDPRALDSIEPHYREDLLAHQVLTSVRAQMQFRRDFKLEDYLQRLFAERDFHPSLPFELNSFAPHDVKEGLRLFAWSTHLERLCQALSKIDFPDIATWYVELIPFDQLDDAQLGLVLKSVSAHLNGGMSSLLRRLQMRAMARPESPLFAQWIEACALALPDADEIFAEFVQGDLLRSLPVGSQIEVLNQLSSFALMVQANPVKRQQVAGLFELALDTGSDASVQSRALRALAEMEFASQRAYGFAKERLNDPAFRPSALQYFEANPGRPAYQLLVAEIQPTPIADSAASASAPAPALLGKPGKPGKRAKPRGRGEVADVIEIAQAKPKSAKPPKVSHGLLAKDLPILRALRTQPSLDYQDATVVEMIERNLGDYVPVENRQAALTLIARFADARFTAGVVRCLKHAERLEIPAILALKAIGGEGALDELAKCLASSRDSTVGRALDAVLSLPGLRAKRIAIDFMVAHADNVGICDKVARCFVPGGDAEYFVEQISTVLERFPQHPVADGLTGLRERVLNHANQERDEDQLVKGAEPGKAARKSADTLAADADLQKRIPEFDKLEESVKSVLRAAEVPFRQPRIFDEHFDKSAAVLQYCKAIDLALERSLGRRHLFPRLEQSLHEFQNVLHSVGLNEEYPPADRLLRNLGLERHFTAAAAPVHKTVLLAQDILSGKIVDERFRSIDGLRAWGILMLLFARKLPGAASAAHFKPLIPVRQISDDGVISFAKRLIQLQEVRNPAAHRQTISRIADIEGFRNEAVQAIQQIQRIF